MKEISDELYSRLLYLGIVNDETDDTRNHNVGYSDYSQHLVQPWTIWLEYGLSPWDADIIKRVLRTKDDTPRTEDYEKIIHICQERLRQVKYQNKVDVTDIDFENVD
jgi:hypothetical protein